MISLVLLPGMDGTGELFHDFLKVLGPEIDPIVVSYPPDRALNYAQLEALVRSKLPADRPYVLLGESFSGPVAVSIAASAPHGLLGLILCCSFVKSPQPAWSVLKVFVDVLPMHTVPTAFLNHALLGRFSSPNLLRTLAQVLARISPQVLRARIRAVIDVNVSTLLSRIRIPVLYLRAGGDRVVPRTASRLIEKLLPKVRLVEIDAPHLLLQVAPVEAGRQIQEFVQQEIGL